MIYFVLPILLQIFCVVHVIRNGRNQGWIFAIVFLPLAGSAAYFFVEIMPTLGSNRHVRTARAQVVAAIDPERELRAAKDRLSVADTVANRIAVADALAGLDRHFDALPLYREALAMMQGRDPQTQLKLARSLFETGASEPALETLDALPPASGIGEMDRRALLRARVLNHLGRNEEAATIFEDIVTRIAGEEARCRYAALLLETNQKARARAILEEVEARMKRLDRTQRAAEAEMYDWAMKQLAGLRAAKA